jgi:ferredoxin/flavodoxin
VNVKKVWAVFFSATGTTRKIVSRVAEVLASELGVEWKTFDFTSPRSRETALSFSATDLVVLGTPVYAGRVPNVLLKYLGTIQGNGTIAVPVVLYGNRNYDDALIELQDLLEGDGFHTVAAGAFIGEHAFSYTLAKGRPDAADMAIATSFAKQVAGKLRTVTDTHLLAPIAVKGVPHPYRGYFQPRDSQGNPIDIRKVKPLTGADCNDCKICAESCPMGSISFDNVTEYTGICIKCGACVKKCPRHARYYEDTSYLYHKRDLEESLTRRAEPELFV